MKQVTALKLTCVGAFIATLGVGCASSGYARYDADSTDMDQGMGVSASADVGTDNQIRTEADVQNELRKDDSTTVVVDTDRDNTVIVDSDDDNVVVNADPEIFVDRDRAILDMEVEGEERVTVSALSFVPETRATWVSKFPFYDRNIRAVEVHTFAVPADIDVDLDPDAPEFRADLPAGSVFVEAAGGAGDVQTGRVIQHSPSPTR